MPVSRLVLPTLLMVALMTGLSAPPSMGQIGIRPAAAPDVTLSFPLFSGENQSLELADYVAHRLRLGQAEISVARLYNVSRLLYDGLSGIYGVSNLLDTLGGFRNASWTCQARVASPSDCITTPLRTPTARSSWQKCSPIRSLPSTRPRYARF